MAMGAGRFGARLCRLAAAVAFFAMLAPDPAPAQLLPGEVAPIPPAAIPNVPAPGGPTQLSPGASLTAPSGGVVPPPPPAAAPPVTPPAAMPAAPAPPPAPTQIALSLGARFGRDPPAITGGLLWRIYHERPDA